MSARLPDWPLRLATYVDQRRCSPFAWGVQDCCQFARGAVIAETGADPLPEIGSYDDARGAAKILRKYRGIERLPAAAGFEEIPLNLAQRGDLVSILDGRRLALGISLGRDAVFAGTCGLTFPPTLQCRRAWRVT